MEGSRSSYQNDLFGLFLDMCQRCGCGFISRALSKMDKEGFTNFQDNFQGFSEEDKGEEQTLFKKEARGEELKKGDSNEQNQSWDNIYSQNKVNNKIKENDVKTRGGFPSKKVEQNFGSGFQENFEENFSSFKVESNHERQSQGPKIDDKTQKKLAQEGFSFQGQGFGFGGNSFGFGMEPNVGSQEPSFKKKEEGFGFGGTQSRNDFSGGSFPKKEWNNHGGENHYRTPRQGQEDNFNSGGFRGGRGRGRGGGRGRGQGRGGFGSFGRGNDYNSDRGNHFTSRGNDFHGNNRGNNFNSDRGSYFNNNYNNNFQHNSQGAFGGSNSSSNFHRNQQRQPQPQQNQQTQPQHSAINLIKPATTQTVKMTVGYIQQIPNRYLCWPKALIYALGKEVSFTERPLYQHTNTDIIGIPFFTTNLQLYGGNIVNSCTINYRKKISNKLEKGLMVYGGQPYMQKVFGNDDFKVIAFIYVDPNNKEESYCSGLEKMFGLIRKLKGEIPQEKIVIPLCLELRPFTKYFKGVIEWIQENKLIKRVMFSMKEDGCYKESLLCFSKVYEQFRTSNLISLE